MSYLLKNNRREKGLSKQILTVCAVIVAAGLIYAFAPRFIGNIAFTVARPVFIAKNYVGGEFEKVRTLFQDKEQLARQNASQRQELDEAKIALQSLDTYKQENEQLKEMLGRTVGEKRTLANILERPPHSLYDTLILDAGESNGIAVGDKVLAGDFVLGRIREVYANYSKATLLSSSGEKNHVLIGQTNIEAEALGRGAGNFIVKLPKEINAAEGDVIKLPGLKPKFLGNVLHIEQTPTGSFQFIFFELPLNINNLRWVEILKS